MSRWTAFAARLRPKPAASAPASPDAASGGPACSNCAFFRNDPADLEAALPGLPGLSSAFGSVRSDDGLCLRHDRFVVVGGSCEAFRRPLDRTAGIVG